MIEMPSGKSHMVTGLLLVVRRRREPQRVVGRTHNLMGSHKRGLEVAENMRLVMVVVEGLSLRRTHLTVKEVDKQEMEIRRKAKKQAFHFSEVIQTLPRVLVQN